MNPDGSGKTNLSASRDTFGSVWSRDGRAIGFTRKTTSSIVDLFFVAPTGGPMIRCLTGRNRDRNWQERRKRFFFWFNSRRAISYPNSLIASNKFPVLKATVVLIAPLGNHFLE
jgi:Tol biopolymer transport system component